MGGSIARVDFKPWYRRREVAFVVGCALHEHRGRVGGVVGIDAIRRALDVADDDIDIGRLAAEGPGGYLVNAYGAFGMYYGAVLRDLRLSVKGLGTLVDRATDQGQEVGEGFAERFESTRYFRDYRDADRIPLGVLAELGEQACLCTLPGRPDHQLLLDAFFGEADREPEMGSKAPHPGGQFRPVLRVPRPGSAGGVRKHRLVAAGDCRPSVPRRRPLGHVVPSNPPVMAGLSDTRDRDHRIAGLVGVVPAASSHGRASTTYRGPGSPRRQL